MSLSETARATVAVAPAVLLLAIGVFDSETLPPPSESTEPKEMEFEGVEEGSAANVVAPALRWAGRGFGRMPATRRLRRLVSRGTCNCTVPAWSCISFDATVFHTGPGGLTPATLLPFSGAVSTCRFT